MGQHLKLNEARELAPMPKGIIGEWAHELRESAYNAITPSDVKEIMTRQVEKAKAGDAAAARFVTGFLIGAGPKQVTVINQKHVHVRRRKRAAHEVSGASDREAFRERMEKLKLERAGIDAAQDPEGHPFWFASPHPIGSPEYHALQTARINAGLPAEHPGDPKPAIEPPKKKHAV